MSSVLNPLLGGALIGMAVTMMLLLNGRVTGISGIISGMLALPKGDTHWRGAFLAGLLAGGLILRFLHPAVFENTSGRGLGMIVLAGLLVGFGTVMGSGCTSGHGVCGISRLSMRSLAATVTFIMFGILAVTAVRILVGGGAA